MLSNDEVFSGENFMLYLWDQEVQCIHKCIVYVHVHVHVYTLYNVVQLPYFYSDCFVDLIFDR